MANLIKIRNQDYDESQGPEWASHRLKIKVKGGDEDWGGRPWFYLGALDRFYVPNSPEAITLRANGYDVWWEGRSDPHRPWEFVEIQSVPGEPVYTVA